MRAPTRSAPTIGVSHCTSMHGNANRACIARNDGYCAAMPVIAALPRNEHHSVLITPDIGNLDIMVNKSYNVAYTTF